MAEQQVRIRIIEAKSPCTTGHTVGEEFEVGKRTPEGLCLTAFAALLPLIRVLGSGGSLGPEKDRIVANCPDSAGGLVFELVREASCCEA